jgi:hypothetical protein
VADTVPSKCLLIEKCEANIRAVGFIALCYTDSWRSCLLRLSNLALKPSSKPAKPDEKKPREWEKLVDAQGNFPSYVWDIGRDQGRSHRDS